MADADFTAHVKAEGADEAAEQLEQVAEAGEAVDQVDAEAQASIETEGEDEAAELLHTLEDVDGVKAVSTAVVEGDVEEGYAVVALLEDVDGERSVAYAMVEGDAAEAEAIAEQIKDFDGVVATATVEVQQGDVSALNRTATEMQHLEQVGTSSWTKLSAGAGQAGEVMAKAGLTGANAMGKASSAIGALATGALPAAAAVSGVTVALKSSMDAYQGTAEQARKLGLITGQTTEEMSRWIAVADDANVSAKDMGTALISVTKNLKSEAWEKYGISITDANGEIRSSGDLLLDVMDVLAAMETPQAQATAGIELLGRGYKSVAPMIGSTREEMEGYLAAVEGGQVITAEEAAKAEEMRVAQDALADSMGEVKLAIGELVVALAPLITKIADVISVVGKVLGPVVDLADGILDLGSKVKDVLSPFDDLKAKFEDLPKPIRGGISAMKDWVSGSDDAADSTENAAAAAAEMAQGFLDSGMSIEQAAAAMAGAGVAAEDIASGMEAAGVSSEDLAVAQANVASAAADAEAAEAALVEQLNAEVEALNASVAASEAKATAMRAAADAQFALTASQAKYNEELAGLNEALNATEGDALKAQVVLDGLAQSAGSAADAEVRLAKDTAEASGAIVTAADELDVWNNSMLEMAASTSGPAQRAIGDYIASVNKIPPSVRTEISAMVEAGDIAGAEAALANASRNRQTLIQADTDTSAAEAKIATVEGIAAGTTAVVPIGADPAPFQAQVNTVAATVPQATITTVAAVEPAAEQIAATALAPYEAMIETDADTRAAFADISQVERDQYNSMIDVDADTALAAGIILSFISRPRTAEIIAELVGVEAVAASLRNLGKPIRVPIDAYLRTVPTAQEITNKIGVVRVPVDAYSRSTPRVSGV